MPAINEYEWHGTPENSSPDSKTNQSRFTLQDRAIEGTEKRVQLSDELEERAHDTSLYKVLEDDQARLTKMLENLDRL